MLVTDPKQRANLGEVMTHPWMTKGYNGPPDNHLPHRDPLQFPIDSEVVQRMTGFDFGPPEFITAQLTKVLESEDYQNAIRTSQKEQHTPTLVNEKKRGVFDFYKRRNSTSRDTLSNPSLEVVQAIDPINGYNPLISIYNLVREKRDREMQETHPGAIGIPHTPSDTPVKVPDLPAPEAAHTNQHAFEVPGENDRGGRSRPRARTHGDEDITEGIANLRLNRTAAVPMSTSVAAPPANPPTKKENPAVGLLRRFSTRRTRDKSRDVDREKPAGPTVNIQPPDDIPAPRKSFSVRRTRRGDLSPGTLHPTDSQLEESPRERTGGGSPSRVNNFLGRSASVNSADYRNGRNAKKRVPGYLSSSAPHEPPLTSGSERSSLHMHKSKPSDLPLPPQDPIDSSRPHNLRTKSLGHARRESIQARRARREEAKENHVPEETDMELAEAGNTSASTGEESLKPVYLKGLFSVSTTSSKPLSVIRSDIIRVLTQLGVEYTEIKGGFSCRHAPSINLDKVSEARPSSVERQGMVAGHRRRISFGGLRGHAADENRDEHKPAHSSKAHRRFQRPPDHSFVTNSEGSDEFVAPRDNTAGERVVGETTTRVQNDTGENLVLKFEILVVKVPLFSLHGIQFKKVAGGMWQYREMAKKILDHLRL